jgi:hypothetical protein
VRLSGFQGKQPAGRKLKTMKIILKTIMVSALVLALTINIFAQNAL